MWPPCAATLSAQWIPDLSGVYGFVCPFCFEVFCPTPVGLSFRRTDLWIFLNSWVPCHWIAMPLWFLKVIYLWSLLQNMLQPKSSDLESVAHPAWLGTVWKKSQQTPLIPGISFFFSLPCRRSAEERAGRRYPEEGKGLWPEHNPGFPGSGIRRLPPQEDGRGSVWCAL